MVISDLTHILSKYINAIGYIKVDVSANQDGEHLTRGRSYRENTMKKCYEPTISGSVGSWSKEVGGGGAQASVSICPPIVLYRASRTSTE